MFPSAAMWTSCRWVVLLLCVCAAALSSASACLGEACVYPGFWEHDSDADALALLQVGARAVGMGALQQGSQSSPLHVRRLRPSCASCTYPYKAWSDLLKAGTCSADATPLAIEITPKTGSTNGTITCALEEHRKVYKFPAGIFEIGEQLLVPANTSILGSSNPNDMAEPTKPPNWREQTLFLATRGVTDYLMNYCHAEDMVSTRVGFVLSSFVTVSDVSYQGIDTIRPSDNGALCGGAAFETKGCAENDCSISSVNNGGSDGIGSEHVIIENVRLNDYYFAEDEAKVGASIEGNYNCSTDNWTEQCCFCKPNGVRASQVGIWVPQSRNIEGTRHLFVNNIVTSALQADGINLHGMVDDAQVQNVYIQNTGDDIYALWGANSNPTNVTFQDCVGVNPGILRPNWYGNCMATYGLQSVVFENLKCQAPTLEHPIPSPSDGSVTIDVSMFVFYNSFGASYPEGNNITIKGWTFEDLQGHPYMPATGTVDVPAPGKMVWTTSKNGVAAPFYFTSSGTQVNVYASPPRTPPPP